MESWPPSRSEIARIFDARADTYDQSEMHRWIAARTVAELGLVHTKVTVLDAASGTGLGARALLERLPSARVVAVDLAVDLLRVARRTEGIEVVNGSVDRLPLSDDCVDIVLCVSAAAYFPDPKRALHEFRRVLRPRGVLILQTWRLDGLAVPRALRIAAEVAGITMPDPNGAIGNPEDLTSALTEAGFPEIRIVHEVWQADWPDARAAWHGLLRGPGQTALSHLSAIDLRDVEAAFIDELHTARRGSSYDNQHLLIAHAS